MNSNEDKRRKSYLLMRMTYDIGMAVFLIGMAVFLLLGNFWGIEQILTIDSTFRYMFGSICLLYGLFRLYRGIKREY
ncbi:MAG TPA: hypothetical protein PKG56_02115 [Chitinophagaceae bacterium]|nr:hypothetical protein [Chitinophagaceae bacterium]MCC6634609.1 hypothetical protein [Chitinophagaceae bacterium]HMZ45415.1 hypothetical protein [Chitinophagaceae bacterium]HNE93536.1 hypothetical protein [Chitinophagaceae bacterium]HNF30624.1 hypothetical protein [Chitinophagaceae bacterium]